MSNGHHDTDCGEVLARVYDFLDHELDGRSLSYQEIETHLAECGPCLSKFDLERVVRQILARSCRGEHAPDELRIRVLARIHSFRLAMPDN